MSKTRQASYKKGLWAESLAALFLQFKGYRILHRRYKCPVGEIDLIARRGNVLAIIEVKARGNSTAALESVTPKNRNRVERAAAHFISRHPDYAGCNLRFDLIALAPPFYMRHLDNAWRPRS